MRLETMPVRHRAAVIGDGERQEMELNVGIGDAGAAADETAALEMVGRAKPVLAQQPARADRELRQRVHRGIERDRLGAFHLEIEFEMVLQIFADPGQIMDHIDTVRPKLRRRSDSGELEQLRRVDRAARQDHLAPRGHQMLGAAFAIGDADRALALPQDMGGERVRFHAEIGPRHRRLEIGIGRAPAAAAMDGHVHAPKAFLLRAVDVVGQRIARLLRRIEKGGVERVLQPAITGVESALGAAIGITALVARLGATEIGEDLGKAPAARALFLPAFEIHRIAANIDQSVDRR